MKKKYNHSNLAKVVGLEFLDYYDNHCKVISICDYNVELTCENQRTGGRFTTLRYRFFEHVANNKYKLLGTIKDYVELPTTKSNNKVLACIL